MASTGQQSGSLQNKGLNPTGKQNFPESSGAKSGGDMGWQDPEAGASVIDKAKETASGVGERLRDAAGSVQDMARKAGDVASNVGQKAVAFIRLLTVHERDNDELRVRADHARTVAHRNGARDPRSALRAASPPNTPFCRLRCNSNH